MDPLTTCRVAGQQGSSQVRSSRCPRSVRTLVGCRACVSAVHHHHDVSLVPSGGVGLVGQGPAFPGHAADQHREQGHGRGRVGDLGARPVSHATGCWLSLQRAGPEPRAPSGDRADPGDQREATSTASRAAAAMGSSQSARGRRPSRARSTAPAGTVWATRTGGQATPAAPAPATAAWPNAKMISVSAGHQGWGGGEGIEPLTSSVRVSDGPPLCRAAFPQVAANRQGRS